MSKKTINIGNSANDGNGEPARSAFSKTNDNFGEIYSKMGDGANLFTPVQQSGGTGQGNNKIYLGWSGLGLKAQVDKTDLGMVYSDYSNKCIGVSQTYQIATNQRAKNTTYQNTSGKPRFIVIYMSQTAGSGDVSLVVNSMSISFGNYTVGQNFTLYALVPDGASYSLNVPSNVSLNLWSWVELS